VSDSSPSGSQQAPADRPLELKLDGFAWEAVEQESARAGVSVQELVSFAVMYYLADVDSGRVARQISRSPQPRSPEQ
jgi:hypothetical protein